MKNVVKKEEANMGQEIIRATVKPKVVEIDYSLDKIEEQNNNLVRYEMNAIEFPLFTKNKKVAVNTSMKYVFDKGGNRYLSVMPLFNSKIPGEFEERIFIALMRLYRENGYDQLLYTDYFTLIEEMNVSYNGKNFARVKEGLNKLNGAIYEFNNCFYSNEYGKILNDQLRTNIFNIRHIDLKEAQEVGADYIKYFRNSKIKEVIRIKFSDMFMENIIRKGFLRFDSKILLEIKDTVARDIYKMVTKWRNKNLYIKLFSRHLASRIPLGFQGTAVPYTIKRISKALDHLKGLDLIRNYKFTKHRNYEDSFYEVFFEKKHNFNFYTDKSVLTGQEAFDIETLEETENACEMMSEGVLKAIEKAKRSVHIAKFKESFDVFICDMCSTEGETVTLELLKRIYSYNKSIDNLPAFIKAIVKNINLEKNIVNTVSNNNGEKKEEKKLEIEEAELIDDIDLKMDELTETQKKYLKRAMDNTSIAEEN